MDLNTDCRLNKAQKAKLWQNVRANRAAFSLYGEIGDNYILVMIDPFTSGATLSPSLRRV